MTRRAALLWRLTAAAALPPPSAAVAQESICTTLGHQEHAQAYLVAR